MKINRNQFLAVVYADLFDYPLTLGETKLWAISGLDGGGGLGKVEAQGGYYFLQGKQRLIELRKRREKAADGKAGRATAVAKVLAKIPTVEAIFLTGSVAAGNAKEDADIDLMVVTKPGVLWMTRGAIVALLRRKGWYRRGKDFSDRVCSNIFLDTDHLEIKDRNLYTAHEILLAKCLFDRGGVERKWLRENSWTRKYLPGAHVYKVNKTNGQFPINSMPNWPMTNLRIGVWRLGIGYWLVGLIEVIAFAAQFLYQKPKQTNERLGWGYAFFHPLDLSREVTERFGKKLEELGIMLKC